MLKSNQLTMNVPFVQQKEELKNFYEAIEGIYKKDGVVILVPLRLMDKETKKCIYNEIFQIWWDESVNKYIYEVALASIEESDEYDAYTNDIIGRHLRHFESSKIDTNIITLKHNVKEHVIVINNVNLTLTVDEVVGLIKGNLRTIIIGEKIANAKEIYPVTVKIRESGFTHVFTSGSAENMLKGNTCSQFLMNK